MRIPKAIEGIDRNFETEYRLICQQRLFPIYRLQNIQNTIVIPNYFATY